MIDLQLLEVKRRVLCGGLVDKGLNGIAVAAPIAIEEVRGDGGRKRGGGFRTYGTGFTFFFSMA